MIGAQTQRHIPCTVSCLSKGVASPIRRGVRHGRTAAMPQPGRQQGHLSQHTVLRRRTALLAVDPDKLGIIRTEELRDGSILFCFGDEADATSSSSAAAEAATDMGVSGEAAKEAASAGQQASTPADSATVATESSPIAAAEGATEQQAAHVSAAAEVSSSDDDPHTKQADAGGSQSQSIDKAQLQDLKVAELKELARENDLKGYSMLRKNELVDFLAEALPGDYQI